MEPVNNLTKEQILAMEPQELAKATAVHVMGWKWIDQLEAANGNHLFMCSSYAWDDENEEPVHDWNPAEYIGDAWRIIEHLQYDYSFEILAEGNYLNPKFEVEVKIGGLMEDYVKAKTMMIAVCRAALFVKFGHWRG